MKYHQIEPGEWINPSRHSYKMACCDCGLVHLLQFRLVGSRKYRQIQFRAFRDDRATAAVRKHRKVATDQRESVVQ